MDTTSRVPLCVIWPPDGLSYATAARAALPPPAEQSLTENLDSGVGRARWISRGALSPGWAPNLVRTVSRWERRLHSQGAFHRPRKAHVHVSKRRLRSFCCFMLFPVFKSYLETFYAFCKNHGDVTAEVMCPILEVRGLEFSDAKYSVLGRVSFL